MTDHSYSCVEGRDGKPLPEPHEVYAFPAPINRGYYTVPTWWPRPVKLVWQHLTKRVLGIYRSDSQ